MSFYAILCPVIHKPLMQTFRKSLRLDYSITAGRVSLFIIYDIVARLAASRSTKTPPLRGLKHHSSLSYSALKLLRSTCGKSTLTGALHPSCIDPAYGRVTIDRQPRSHDLLPYHGNEVGSIRSGSNPYINDISSR